MKNIIFPIIGGCLFSLVGFTSKGQSSHIYTHTPMQLKSISSLPVGAYKTAAICFLGSNCLDDSGFNKGNGEEFEVDSKKQCTKEGFNLTSCPSGYALSGMCPYDNRYFQNCISYKQLCEQDNYYQTCTGDVALDSSKTCKYDSSYKKCTSKAELCENIGYQSGCEDGKIKDPGQTCPQDSTYQKCVCSPCDGYSYTYEEASAKGYEADGDACNSCGVLKYRSKAKECLGFTECECGGEVGAVECWSGSLKKFTSCKRCDCSNGTLDIETYWCNGDFKCLFGGR